ncbi:ATP-binding protein [Actinomyces oris]|uniref:ATP-binding protein n=1 Tax=Actinomyces oris TaxID=544580 RepID=A0AAE4G4E1_9ACTO|nr:ATP-binding protein [Actinomyces oris]MDT0249240.1 ATP-binding protein [Actinomyces oris]
MTDRLGGDAERVSCLGEYRLHVRRLVALFAGLGVLEIGILSGPTVYFTDGVNPIAAAILLAPIVGLAVVIASVAAGAIYLRRCGSPRRDLLRRADRLLAGLLAALLGVYVAVACVLAATRLLPIAAPGDALARMHPMLGWYFVIAAAGAVVLTRRWRFTFVVAMAPLLVMVNATAIGELQFVSVEDVMLDMTTNLATIGALTWLLRLAETSDASSAQQRAQAVELAAQQASTRAQHEANSFIHDHILSALIAVANGLPDREALRDSARQALDSLSTETTVASPVAARTLLNDVAGCVGAMAGDIRTDVLLAREHEIPPEVAQAITEATLEAVRNSLRHAGDDAAVTRTVTLTSDACGVTIEVNDNGCGFDPAVDGRGRHGVSGSIIARMQDVGGRATVDSAPREGTCITLRWRPLLDSANRQRPEREAAQNEAASWERSLSASMESAGARAIAAGLALVHFILLVYECAVHSYWHWPPAALSFIALLLPTILLLKTWPDALLPRWVARLTVIVIGAVNFLVLPQIITTGWPGYASWCTGAGNDLSCGLLMRGRSVYAWAGSAATTLTIIYWVFSTGRPLLMIFTYMLGHYFTLVSWHGVAHLSTRATTQIAATQRETARLQAQQRAHEEADRIMTSRMAAVRQRVTPLLPQIADGKAPTPKLRSQAYLLEAELRDEIRAPFFTGTSIVTSAQAARRRGTEVILLDDSGDTTIDDQVRTNAVNYVTKFLNVTQSNRVVIRLNPPRRPTLLTIVTDDTRYRLDRQGELIAESEGGQVN